ncbi:unnamed protein product [Rhizoctonia solani]|uniref:Autophagy-related protein 18 n=1 Tax=Rhizoctonia solani TaxID=456999 RepID=A0A8H3GKL0_9AGAM|nr:unnamed protein product [Rhizoctonia solani]
MERIVAYPPQPVGFYMLDCQTICPPPKRQSRNPSENSLKDVIYAGVAVSSKVVFGTHVSAGTPLATASEKQTTVRVFSIPATERLYEFRRVRGAAIHCITFNAVSTLLAVSSATDTEHIFKIQGSNEEGEKKWANGRPSSPGKIHGTEKGGEGLEGGYETYMHGKEKDRVESSLHHKALGLIRVIAGMVTSE